MQAQEQTKEKLSRLLKLAILTGVEKAVKIQLKTPAIVNAQDGNGTTPLMLAAQRGHIGVCSLLLAEGADIEIQDSSGKSALSYAEAKNHTDIVHLLVDHLEVKEQNQPEVVMDHLVSSFMALCLCFYYCGCFY